jgi:hypothetical protein
MLKLFSHYCIPHFRSCFLILPEFGMKLGYYEKDFFAEAYLLDLLELAKVVSNFFVFNLANFSISFWGRKLCNPCLL